LPSLQNKVHRAIHKIIQCRIAANDCSHHAVPAYGQQNCGIVEAYLGEYLYYPAAVLLFVNVSLFAATCIKLCMYGRGPAIRTKKNDPFGEWYAIFLQILFLILTEMQKKRCILQLTTNNDL